MRLIELSLQYIDFIFQYMSKRFKYMFGSCNVNIAHIGFLVLFPVILFLDSHPAKSFLVHEDDLCYKNADMANGILFGTFSVVHNH
jgi:hypothetical protein